MNTPSLFYKAYAGLGDQNTPESVLAQMAELARDLEAQGWTLRVDGTPKPGNSFKDQAPRHELHLPCKGFDNQESKYVLWPKDPNYEKARLIAKEFNPVFDTLPKGVQAILAAKVTALLGLDLKSHVKFLICWSPDGAEHASQKSAKTGFMGMPVALASAAGIRIFNLYHVDAAPRLRDFLSTLPY
jgi:hypothetical protein